MGNSSLGHPFFLGGAGLLALAVLTAGCATGGGLTPGAQPPSEAITGSYDVSFTDHDGSSYEGTLEISRLGRLLYWLAWHGSDRGYVGRGALIGNSLHAVWGSGKSRCLAAVLEVSADGNLDGVWFRAEDRTGATSRIQAVPETRSNDDSSGRYSVATDDPDSTNLPSALQVTSLGDGYHRFLWTGAEQLEGRGRLDDESMLVVASIVGSGDTCRISEMSLVDDGSLSWTWMK